MKIRIPLFITCIMMLSFLTACGSNSTTKDTTADTSETITEGTTAGTSKTTEDTSTNISEVATEEEPNTQSKETLFSQINTTTLDGEEVTGDDIKGEVLTVLNIWATWCSPCVSELPYLEEISKEFESQGVKIVGVMQDGVTEFLKRSEDTIESGKLLILDAGVEYTVILPDETIQSQFISSMQYFPTTYFLDADGNVIKSIVGSNDADGWRDEIEAVLEEIL